VFTIILRNDAIKGTRIIPINLKVGKFFNVARDTRKQDFAIAKKDTNDLTILYLIEY
jgi:hypothetical protein